MAFQNFILILTLHKFCPEILFLILTQFFLKLKFVFNHGFFYLFEEEILSQ